MNRRAASQPEHQALTAAAIALAALTFTHTPGVITPLAAATITYLTVITAAAWALRWNLPHTLTATTLILRNTLAHTLRALIVLIVTATNWALWILTNTTATLAPQPNLAADTARA